MTILDWLVLTIVITVVLFAIAYALDAKIGEKKERKESVPFFQHFCAALSVGLGVAGFVLAVVLGILCISKYMAGLY